MSDDTIACGYADETQYNVGQYRGVALVSALAPDAARLAAEVRSILSASGARECKWERVRSTKGRFLAAKLLAWTLDSAIAGRMRVDALTWDAGNSAHAGAGTPYLKKLHQMYRHLLAEALAHRWLDAATWTLYPDEQNALRWDTIAAGLPRLARIVPVESSREPLIQIADLFAGLAVFSRAGYDTYEQWLCLPATQRRSPSGKPGAGHAGFLSASDRYRCLLLDDFFTCCKSQLPGISLRTNRGLRTYDPERAITFRWDTIH
jgi:hypothetical protein